VRREAHHHLAAGGRENSWSSSAMWPVMADAIGVEALRHFGEQHLLLGRPPAPVMPDLASITISSGTIALALSSGVSASCAQLV
jgi:hypothetical protein